MTRTYPFYIGSRPESPNKSLTVRNKYTGQPFASVALADRSDVSRRIQAAVDAAPAMARLTPFERRAVLEHCIREFMERSEELAEILCIEAGKSIKDSRSEVTRLIETFQIAATETTRAQGEVLNLEISERNRGYRGFTKRVPTGPCSFITPFNFPLNLVAHKVAPAIAAGCPFILKPDSRTPLGALIIGEILTRSGLPEGAFSILPCEVEQADAFTTDDRLKLLSFTGSPRVGWELKRRAGKKKVVLELGGNAACIVDSGADVDDAVQRCIVGAFYQSGQSCISVQRIYLHESLAAQFEEKFISATESLTMGDPGSEDTFLGPMIDETQSKRVEDWLKESVQGGAQVLTGGERTGNFFEPTLLKNVDHDAKIYCEEAFGPIALLETFSDFEAVLDIINESRFGIHAGVFTPNINHAFLAWDRLEVGGVLINEIPSWRVDNLPYGGVKESGLGREGLRYAIDDMTEIRTMILRTPN